MKRQRSGRRSGFVRKLRRDASRRRSRMTTIGTYVAFRIMLRKGLFLRYRHNLAVFSQHNSVTVHGGSHQDDASDTNHFECACLHALSDSEPAPRIGAPCRCGLLPVADRPVRKARAGTRTQKAHDYNPVNGCRNWLSRTATSLRPSGYGMARASGIRFGKSYSLSAIVAEKNEKTMIVTTIGTYVAFSIMLRNQCFFNFWALFLLGSQHKNNMKERRTTRTATRADNE